MVKNRRELPASRFNRVNSSPIRFPPALRRRIILPHWHGRSRDAPITTEPAIATPASETGYVPAMAIASLGDPVSIKAV